MLEGSARPPLPGPSVSYHGFDPGADLGIGHGRCSWSSIGVGHGPHCWCLAVAVAVVASPESDHPGDVAGIQAPVIRGLPGQAIPPCAGQRLGFGERLGECWATTAKCSQRGPRSAQCRCHLGDCAASGSYAPDGIGVLCRLGWIKGSGSERGREEAAQSGSGRGVRGGSWPGLEMICHSATLPAGGAAVEAAGFQQGVPGGVPWPRPAGCPVASRSAGSGFWPGPHPPTERPGRHCTVTESSLAISICPRLQNAIRTILLGNLPHRSRPMAV